MPKKNSGTLAALRAGRSVNFLQLYVAYEELKDEELRELVSLVEQLYFQGERVLTILETLRQVRILAEAPELINPRVSLVKPISHQQAARR